MPLPSRFFRALRDGSLPARTRLDVAVAELRRRVRQRESYPVHLGPSTVHLSNGDHEIDWKSLLFVILDEPYRSDYEGAIVLDIGAHKGYYGAYALARGAQTVVSFEPEDGNLEYLERSAGSHRAEGAVWIVRRVAVGARAGEADLHVMGASWGHALHPPDRFAEYEVGSQRVRVEALADVLEEARTLATESSRLIVKLNIEGEECSAVLDTPAAAWNGVDELLVETHPWATCGADELASHVGRADLIRAESVHPLVLRMHRPRSARADRRSAPT